MKWQTDNGSLACVYSWAGKRLRINGGGGAVSVLSVRILPEWAGDFWSKFFSREFYSVDDDNKLDWAERLIKGQGGLKELKSTGSGLQK